MEFDDGGSDCWPVLNYVASQLSSGCFLQFGFVKYPQQIEHVNGIEPQQLTSVGGKKSRQKPNTKWSTTRRSEFEPFDQGKFEVARISFLVT